MISLLAAAGLRRPSDPSPSRRDAADAVRTLPVIDLIKVVAAQLIVWHHLAFYGPLSEVANPAARRLVDWLYDDARIAVQCFLVVAGFLAARSLVPGLGRGMRDFAPLALIWQRYLRLARPYAVALVAALFAAAVARRLAPGPDIPQAPDAWALLAHLFFLQDLLHVEALSAGVWYVAIDFQLYVGFVLLLWVISRLRPARPWRWVAATSALLAVASLFFFNRDTRFDVWAMYFFGAYGMGVLAHCMSRRERKAGWMLAVLAMVAAALLVEWRERVLVAALTAALLGALGNLGGRGRLVAINAYLARISYAVFLIHYPVFLLVAALVGRLWPTSVTAHVLAMFATWLLSLGAGALLDRLVSAMPHGERAVPAVR